MRILVMGLPGSGKSNFSRELHRQLENSVWFNADIVREMYNDWDFSPEGRLRQAKRMRSLADKSIFKYQIADFVAPMYLQREIYKPDFTIWMNTVTSSKFLDTNDIFEKPSTPSLVFNSFDEIDVIKAIDLLIN